MRINLNYGLIKTGLPLIVIQIAECNLCFIVDTGANLSFIDSKVVDFIKDSILLSDKEIIVSGIDGNQIESNKEAKVTFKVNDYTFTHTFISKPLIESLKTVELESGIQIHGIIGNDFLIKYKWVIDFEKLEVYSSENNKN